MEFTFTAPREGQKLAACYALHFMPGLTQRERRVAACLVWHANAKTGRCDPGMASLAKRTRLDKRDLRRAIKGLLEKGIIHRALRGQNSTAYRIAWDHFTKVFSEFEAGNPASETPHEKPCIRNPASDAQGGYSPPTRGADDPSPQRGYSPPQTLEAERLEGEHLADNGITDRDPTIYEPFYSQDVEGQYILTLENDKAFLGRLQRAVTNELQFSEHIADAITERLGVIFDDHGSDAMDPIGGWAYGLLQSQPYYREEAA